MKQGKSLIAFVMVMLAAALAVYFGYYIYDTLSDPFTTTLAYSYTAYDSARADGLLVREETVLPQQAGIVELSLGEGEKVGVGQTVALVYRDAQAQADQAQLDELAMEVALLREAAAESGDAGSAARLDEEILQAVVALRSSAALGDFTRLEEQVMAVKSGVLKRGYTYGEGLTAADLTARIRELSGAYTQLSAQTASATTRVTAQQAGAFSALVDGYEAVLTPASALQLTPSGLSALMAGEGVPQGEGLGKVITSNRWLFAALIPAGAAEQLQAGDTVTLRFTGDFSQDVDMRVEQVGEPEGEQAVAVFSSDRYLEQTTLLRRQTAQLIFDSQSGLRIPKVALRAYARVDSETGERITEDRFGVYAIVGGRAEFKEVEIAAEGSDYYVVQPADTGSGALRAGDTVIVRAVGLYDSQLLEY